MNKIIKSIDKLAKGIDLHELENWAKSIKKEANLTCNGLSSAITFKHAKNNRLYVSLNDKKSADCMTQAIESCTPSMSLFLQGVFTKFLRDIREAKFSS